MDGLGVSNEQYFEDVLHDTVDSYYNLLLAEGRLEEELLQYYTDVELWILRGRYNKTNFDLLEEILKGKRVNLYGQALDS